MRIYWCTCGLKQRLPQCNANKNFNEIYMRHSRLNNIVLYVLRNKLQYCLCVDRISKVLYNKYCTVPMKQTDSNVLMHCRTPDWIYLREADKQETVRCSDTVFSLTHVDILFRFEVACKESGRQRGEAKAHNNCRKLTLNMPIKTQILKDVYYREE